MTRIHRFDQELIEGDIFLDDVTKSNKLGHIVKLCKGYYNTSEMINFLMYWETILNFSEKRIWFAILISRTKQTVQNMCITWKVTYLKDWYYDKNKLVKYLTKKLW